MTKMLQDVAEEFARRVTDGEKLLYLTRDAGLQRETLTKLRPYFQELESYRAAAEAAGAEHPANILLGFKSVVSALAEELNLYLFLKADEPDAAWDALIRAQAGIDAALRAHESFAYLAGKVQRLRDLESFLFPPVQFLSAGMIVRRQECSICHGDYAACDHLAGRPYCGRFCYVVLRDVEPDHVALVEEPANRHCRVVAFSVPGGRKNVMTWRIAPNPGSEPQVPDDHFVAESVIATQMDFEGESPTGTPFPFQREAGTIEKDACGLERRRVTSKVGSHLDPDEQASDFWESLE